MRLFFVEGRDIGDRALLAATAAELGMDAALVAGMLADGTDVDTVREEIETARQLGVTGVPFFIFGGAVAVSGAQPPEVLRDALLQSRSAR